MKYLLDFDRAFPDAKTVMMTENYRSTPQILAAANALISKNTERIPKDLTAILPDGEPVLCFHGETQEAEAEWIAERISGLRERGIAFRDIDVYKRQVYNFISFLRNGVWNQDTIFMGIFFVVIFTVCIVIRREISR